MLLPVPVGAGAWVVAAGVVNAGSAGIAAGTTGVATGAGAVVSGPVTLDVSGADTAAEDSGALPAGAAGESLAGVCPALRAATTRSVEAVLVHNFIPTL